MEESSNLNSGLSIDTSDDLIDAVRKQVEYYFSKENLQSDVFLVSQMDANQSVSIDVIMKFSKLKALTQDEKIVMEALKQSTVCSIENRRIKGTLKPASRSTLILRDIPSNAPESEVREIFAFDSCKAISSLRSDIGDTWFVLFENEDDAKDTLADLKNQKRTFRGQPIKGRVKSEPVVRSYFPVQSPPSIPPLGVGIPMYPGIPPYPTFMTPALGVQMPMPFGFPNTPPIPGIPGPFPDVDMASKMQPMNAAQAPNKPISPGATGATGNGKSNRTAGTNNGQNNVRSGNNMTAKGPRDNKNTSSNPSNAGGNGGSNPSNVSGVTNNPDKKNNREGRKNFNSKTPKEGETVFDNNILNFPPLNEGGVVSSINKVSEILNIAKPYLSDADMIDSTGSGAKSLSEKLQQASINDVKTDKTNNKQISTASNPEESNKDFGKQNKPKPPNSKSDNRGHHSTGPGDTISSSSNDKGSSSSPETIQKAPAAGSWAGILLSGNMNSAPGDPSQPKPGGVKKPPTDKPNASTSPSSLDRKTDDKKSKTDKEPEASGKKAKNNSNKSESSGSKRGKKEGAEGSEQNEDVPTPSTWGGRPTFANILRENQAAAAASASAPSVSSQPQSTDNFTTKDSSSKNSNKTNSNSNSNSSAQQSEGDKKTKAAAMSSAWRKDSVANQKVHDT